VQTPPSALQFAKKQIARMEVAARNAFIFWYVKKSNSLQLKLQPQDTLFQKFQ
jgi:hypothetical protein